MDFNIIRFHKIKISNCYHLLDTYSVLGFELEVFYMHCFLKFPKEVYEGGMI